MCYDYFIPPNVTRMNGHAVCKNYRNKLTLSPTCREPIRRESKNLLMDAVGNIIDFPCKFNTNGCVLKLKCGEKLQHEKICDGRLYFCPFYPNICKLESQLENFTPHIAQHHKFVPTIDTNPTLSMIHGFVATQCKQAATLNVLKS